MLGISGKKVFTLIVLIFAIAACNKKSCEDTINGNQKTVDLKIIRLENDFFNLKNADQATFFLDVNPVLAEAFYQRSQYPHDSILINKLLALSGDMHLDTVRNEVNKVFGNLDELRTAFEMAFSRIKVHYPEFRPPTIKTIITGLAPGNDLYISPELIIIGLDWFLGDQGTFKPRDIPDYIQDRLTKEYIVASCILFLSDNFNQTDLQDQTMLAEMVYYGKAYAFSREMLPCAPDSIIVGYTQQQLEGIEYNQERIWAHFIESSLLYEKNHFTKLKYLNERPNVPEIGNECPGRIGRWLGWEIVNQYVSKTDVQFVDLMNEADATEIFRLSKYRPDHR